MDKVQEQLIVIWKQVLETDTVTVTDNFFELGGNSIRIVQLHEQIQQQYPDVIKMVDIFSNPTIELLALVINERTNAPVQNSVDRVDF